MVGTINPKVTHVYAIYLMGFTTLFFVQFYTIHLWVVRNSYCFFEQFYTIHLWVVRNSYCFIVQFYTIHLWVVRNSYCFSSSFTQSIYGQYATPTVFRVIVQLMYGLLFLFFSRSCTQSIYGICITQLLYVSALRPI